MIQLNANNDAPKLMDNLSITIPSNSNLTSSMTSRSSRESILFSNVAAIESVNLPNGQKTCAKSLSDSISADVDITFDQHHLKKERDEFEKQMKVERRVLQCDVDQFIKKRKQYTQNVEQNENKNEQQKMKSEMNEMQKLLKAEKEKLKKERLEFECQKKQHENKMNAECKRLQEEDTKLKEMRHKLKGERNEMKCVWSELKREKEEVARNKIKAEQMTQTNRDRLEEDVHRLERMQRDRRLDEE